MPTFVKREDLSAETATARPSDALEPPAPVTLDRDSAIGMTPTPSNDFVRFAGALATFREQRSKLAAEIERCVALTKRSQFLTSSQAALWAEPEGPKSRVKPSTKRHASTASRVSETRRLTRGSANSNAAAGEETARLAHELNNLLGVINAYAELLSQTPLDESQKQDVREIMNVATRAAALMRQALNPGGPRVGMRQKLDLSAVVDETRSTLKPLLGSSITVSTRRDGELEPVVANREQIHQILLNLILNAKHAMPDGGEIALETAARHFEPSIDPDAPRPGRYVVIAVRDTGCGMDAETLARLFEPYFTTKIAKGTGLGLVNVRAIVIDHGGFVRVASQVGHGTTFEVCLPVARP